MMTSNLAHIYATQPLLHRLHWIAEAINHLTTKCTGTFSVRSWKHGRDHDYKLLCELKRRYNYLIDNENAQYTIVGNRCTFNDIHEVMWIMRRPAQ